MLKAKSKQQVVKPLQSKNERRSEPRNLFYQDPSKFNGRSASEQEDEFENIYDDASESDSEDSLESTSEYTYDSDSTYHYNFDSKSNDDSEDLFHPRNNP